MMAAVEGRERTSHYNAQQQQSPLWRRGEGGWRERGAFLLREELNEKPNAEERERPDTHTDVIRMHIISSTLIQLMQKCVNVFGCC